MFRIQRLLAFFIILFVGSVWALTQQYVLKNGESLSQVAWRHMTTPTELYGTNGRLEHLIAANPQIKDPNKVYKGEKIFIPSNDQKVSRKIAEASEAKPILTDKPEKKDFNQWKINLGLAAGFLRIDAQDAQTGGKAEILSDTAPVVSLKTTQIWTKDLETYQEIQLANYQFTHIKINQNVKNPGLLTQVKFVLSTKSYEQNKWLISLGVEQALFIHTLDKINYEFEKIPFINLGLGYDFNVLKAENLSLHMRPSAEFLNETSSANMKVKNGWRGALEVYTQYEKADQILRAGVLFGKTFQDSDLVKQEKTELLFKFDYDVWNF